LPALIIVPLSKILVFPSIPAEVVNFVKNNLPINFTVEYCFDQNIGTSFAYRNIINLDSSENILFTSGDAVAKSFVYERLINKSVSKRGIIIGSSTNVKEADTHPLVLSKNDEIISYRWPVKEIIPETSETRDMTIVSGRRIELLNLIDTYSDQPSVLGVFRNAVVDDKFILNEVFDNDWLHIAYPSDLEKHWL